MSDLTIIKQNGSSYIDSRDVAEAIGKRHDNLLRDISKYRETIAKIGLLKVEESDFFVESSYFNAQHKTQPCYLITKMGCELIANKLIGEKGVMFTVAYVKKFNAMESAERDAEIKAYSAPRLNEFNAAVKNVLNGMSYCCTMPNHVMGFLRGVYNPLGIEVLAVDDSYDFFTATEIAAELGIYSDTGRPHGHAVSAIISKFGNPADHAVAIPYGLVGVSMRYDSHIAEAVWDWIINNGFPDKVPYLDFDYHIYYDRHLSLFDDENEI